MQLFHQRLGVGLICVSWLTGCGETPSSTPPPAPVGPKNRVVKIEAGPDAAKRVQEAFITAKTGDVVECGAGTFEFRSGLSLDINGVTLRGQGPDKTIFSFKDQGQGTGGEGILVTAKQQFIIADMSIQDTKGDGIKVNGTDNVAFHNLKVTWTGGAKETNGGYGIYPVQCKNVEITKCFVSGASDSGIYVGQSQNIVMAENSVEQNVAGIEIENSNDADVYDNIATDNTGGILVFSLPNLPKKDGKNCRVYHNKINNNNHANFAPKGNIVASVPPGTGVMIMAADNVEVFDNDLQGNNTVGVSVVSFLITQRPLKDDAYNPYCEGISIHHNRFAGNGTKPQGSLSSILLLVLGTPFPDILYDGFNDPKSKAPAFSLRENGDAKFANFDARALDPAKMLTGKKPNIVRDTKAYAAEIPPLPPVVLEGAK